MASSRPTRGRLRGTIGWLPSGSARVKVYVGIDQLTGQKLWLRQTVAAEATRRETQDDTADAPDTGTTRNSDPDDDMQLER